MTKNEEIGQANRFKALLFIWRFGWLRPQEIGRAIWPTTKTQAKSGEALVRKLIKEKLVIVRKLPGSYGSALLLSDAGARFLRENDNRQADAKPGKDWGETKDGKFTPPVRTWKHALLANSFLIMLKNKYPSSYIYSETELRRRYGPQDIQDKIPDGLLTLQDQTYWLEVENSYKAGDEMKKVVFAIAKVCEGNSQPFFKRQPTKFAIAVPPNSKDHRGKVIDHKQNVINKVKKNIEGSVNITFFHLKIEANCVVDFIQEEVEVHGDAALRRIQQKDDERRHAIKMQKLQEWNEFEGSQYCGLWGTDLMMEIWKEQRYWCWRVYEEKIVDERTRKTVEIDKLDGKAPSETECRARALAAAISIRDAKH